MMGSNGRAVLVGAVTTTVTFWAFTFTQLHRPAPDGAAHRHRHPLLRAARSSCCCPPCWPGARTITPAQDAAHALPPQLRLRGPDAALAAPSRGRRCLIGVVITLVSLALAVNIEFDESMKTMRPKGNRGIDVAEEVGKKFGSGFDSMSVILTGETPEEVIELSGQAAQGAQRLVADRHALRLQRRDLADPAADPAAGGARLDRAGSRTAPSTSTASAPRSPARRPRKGCGPKGSRPGSTSWPRP